MPMLLFFIVSPNKNDVPIYATWAFAYYEMPHYISHISIVFLLPSNSLYSSCQADRSMCLYKNYIARRCSLAYKVFSSLRANPREKALTKRNLRIGKSHTETKINIVLEMSNLFMLAAMKCSNTIKAAKPLTNSFVRIIQSRKDKTMHIAELSTR